MNSFIGDYEIRVDDKGRLLFPSALRKQNKSASPDRYVVKKDIYESCLVLFPMDEWERQNALIRRNTNPYNKEQAQFLREFYRGTAEISLDSNGRLLIPKRLLEMVNISKDIVLSGQDSKIEIWSKERYDSNGLDEQKFASLAERVMGSSQLKEE